MSNVFEYRGYLGSAEVDTEGRAIVGRLLFIRDIITYSASSVSEIEAAFKAAVDDYVATCEELGDEPDVPCKGNFNVRIPPELHRDISLLARSRKVKLNEFVYQALLIAAQDTTRRPVEHIHQHNHNVTVMVESLASSAAQIASATQPTSWGNTYATKH